MTVKEKISPLAWNLLIFSAIIAASFACYWGASDIFFVADDFLWLERAKYTVPNDFLSIFKPESWTYFDTLVHLLFRANFIFAGLNPAWYHRTDLIIHSINASLVAYLAFLLTRNRTASFFSGFIFAVSHTNSDSVLFMSDRVDTLAALFYLSSIVLYIHYQKERHVKFYYLSISFFVISLFAKITPVILPLIILTLELTAQGEEKRTKKVLVRLVPYFILSAAYLIVLSYGFPKGMVQPGSGLNTKDFLRGISVLFFPESMIVGREGVYNIISILLMASAAGLGAFLIPRRSLFVILVMIAAIIGPLLFLRLSFVYASPSTPPYFVLGSICHRLYLGVSGFSILIGTIVAFSLEKSKKYKVLWCSTIIFMVSIFFYYGHNYAKERQGIWRAHARQYTDYVGMIKGIEDEKRNLSGYSSLYLIGSPFRSFTQSIIRVYSENGDLVVKHVRHYSEIPDGVSSSERSAVWALSRRAKFVDVTEDVSGYQGMRNTCGNIADEKERKGCWVEFSALTNRINALILF